MRSLLSACQVVCYRNYKGRYKKGNYTLRPSLADLYNLRDNPPDPEMLKKGDTEKEIFDRIRNAKDARKKVSEVQFL